MYNSQSCGNLCLGALHTLLLTPGACYLSCIGHACKLLPKTCYPHPSMMPEQRKESKNNEPREHIFHSEEIAELWGLGKFHQFMN